MALLFYKVFIIHNTACSGMFYPFVIFQSSFFQITFLNPLR